MTFTVCMNSFYLNGASKIIAQRHYHQAIRAEMNAIEWVESHDYYNRIPEYLRSAHIKDLGQCSKVEMESMYSSMSLEKCPPVILSTLNKMINDPMVMGAMCHSYHYDVVSVDMWDGVEPLDWHFDGSLSAEVIGLMYFNDAGIVGLDYGGDLVTGIREIGSRSNIMKDYGNVNVLSVIPPSDRVLVFLNNRAPIFVHKVNALKNPSSQRLTLTFGCKATLKNSDY